MKKKRITGFILATCFCLLTCVSFLAGCSLVTTDMSKYYNTPVASFSYENGEKVNVTKRELITAFNSYGYQYNQNYGMSLEEAYKYTLDAVINQKLVIASAEDRAKQINGGEILTTKQKTYLWETTYEAIEDNIINYYNDINNITDDEQESSKDGVVTQEIFSPTAEFVSNNDGTYSIVLQQTTTSDVDSHDYWSGADRDINTQNDLEALYNYVLTFINEQNIYTQAFNKYVNEARSAEAGMNLSTDNKSVFKREIMRVYQVLYDSFMVEQYQEQHQGSNSSVTISNILEAYTNRVINGYNKYVTEGESTYEDDVLEGVADVNYFKTTGTQFFYVSHILAKFTDDQQDEHDRLTAIINGESDGPETIGEAQSKLDDLYAELAFPVRELQDDGQWVEVKDEDGNTVTKSAAAVMQEVALKLATAGSDEYLKAEYFEEFIYKYNQDDGIFNADRNYVIGIDYSTPDEENGTSYTIHSSMVENFTDAAISLYNQGSAKIGDVYLPDPSDYSSGLIKTEYGVHIMVFEGKVENLFSGIDENFNLTISDLQKLDSKQARLKAGVDKTIFDEIFEELHTDNFSTFENMDLQFLRSEVSIEYYPDAYKDLI